MTEYLYKVWRGETQWLYQVTRQDQSVVAKGRARTEKRAIAAARKEIADRLAAREANERFNNAKYIPYKP